jgi:hypothetical protein
MVPLDAIARLMECNSIELTVDLDRRQSVRASISADLTDVVSGHDRGLRSKKETNDEGCSFYFHVSFVNH